MFDFWKKYRLRVIIKYLDQYFKPNQNMNIYFSLEIVTTSAFWIIIWRNVDCNYCLQCLLKPYMFPRYLCLLGNFVCFFVVYGFFSKSILSGIPSECQTVWIQIKSVILSGLVLVQTVCKADKADNSNRQIIKTTIFTTITSKITVFICLFTNNESITSFHFICRHCAHYSS